MDVQSRRCSCGQTFRLATLMSRETQCVACQRKKATALNEAREAERAKAKPAMTVPRMVPDHHVDSLIDAYLNWGRAPSQDVCRGQAPEPGTPWAAAFKAEQKDTDAFDCRIYVKGGAGDPNVVDGVEFSSDPGIDARVGNYTLGTAKLSSGEYIWGMLHGGNVGSVLDAQGRASTLRDARECAVKAMRVHELESRLARIR